MYRVEFRYWKNGSGFSHNETVDNIDEEISAYEYVNALEDHGILNNYDGINVEIYDEDDNLLSEYFWQEVKDEIKEIRKQTGLSQAKFAAYYHIPKRTLESWEMGQRECPGYVVELLRRAVDEDFAS